MTRLAAAICGTWLTVSVATALTTLNGSETEASFSWGRQVVNIGLATLVLLGLAYVGSRPGTREVPRLAIASAAALVGAAAAVAVFNRGIDLRDAWARSTGPNGEAEPGGREEFAAVALLLITPVLACGLAGRLSRPFFASTTVAAGLTWLVGVAFVYSSREL